MGDLAPFTSHSSGADGCTPEPNLDFVKSYSRAALDIAGVPERSNGPDCKSGGLSPYVGSNPIPCIFFSGIHEFGVNRNGICRTL